MRLFVKLLASTGFVGYFPYASGTVASALAAGVIFATGSGSAVWWALGTLAVGLVISKKAVEAFSDSDPHAFVLDEWCGMAITLVGVPVNLAVYGVGFLLFRFFDIVKPAGIRRLDRMRHPFGIVLDDALAGLYANLILQAVWRVGLKQAA